MTQAVCRCPEVNELRGDEARSYADAHLRVIERGRDPDGCEDYQCDETGKAWVIDYPSRHWAGPGRGEPRLRRLHLLSDAPPLGGPWE